MSVSQKRFQAIQIQVEFGLALNEEGFEVLVLGNPKFLFDADQGDQLVRERVGQTDAFPVDIGGIEGQSVEPVELDGHIDAETDYRQYDGEIPKSQAFEDG
jgi:hypothetical protein